MMLYLTNPNIEILNNQNGIIVCLEKEYYYLNEISYSILNFCKTASSFNSIVNYIIKNYKVEKNIVEKDIKNILQDFLSYGILILRGDKNEKI